MTNALVVNHDPIELVAPLTALPQRSQPRPTNLLASPISDVALTDEALLSAWLRAKAAGANPRSKHTLTQYRSEATRWAWYAFHVAQTAITQWTREHVIDFLDYLHQVPSDHILSNEARRGRKLKPVDPAWRPFRAQPSRASIAQIQVILRGFYSWLLANGHLLVHPMAGINAPKRRQRTRKHKHFTPAECSKILDAVSRFELKTHQQRRQWARARFAFVCLARTGLRPFELAAAKMSDITRHAAVIHAQAAEVWVLSVEHGKGDKQRDVPFDACMAELARYRRLFGASLMPTPKDHTRLLLSIREASRHRPAVDVISTKTLERDLKALLAAAADRLAAGGEAALAEQIREASPYWLRHTFATAMVKAVGIEKSAQLLGHADPRTTMIYLAEEAVASALAIRDHLPV